MTAWALYLNVSRSGEEQPRCSKGVDGMISVFDFLKSFIEPDLGLYLVKRSKKYLRVHDEMPPVGAR